MQIVLFNMIVIKKQVIQYEQTLSVGIEYMIDSIS